MNTSWQFLRLLGLSIFLLFLTACAPAASPAAPTPTPAPTLPAATATPIPTATPVPRTAASVIAATGDKEWDYVVMGDSTVSGLTTHYTEYLEQDLGIKIKIHPWIREGGSSEGMLNALRTDEKLRKNLSEAEVITFIIPRWIFQVPAETYLLSGPGACGGADNQDCLRQALKSFEADTDAIIAEIVSLRSPSDALIRAVDAHTYWPVAESKQNGAFAGVAFYWQAANQHLAQTAGERHIPVARVYDAFNGPGGDEDPRDNGYVLPDALHPTEKGGILMAELVRNLGYEYAPAQ